jgi:hypothetical protein
VTATPILGRVETVLPRDVWPHEAHSFTPWLLANVDVLSSLLGMDLVLEAAEHPVGDFSLDLIGRDEATGERVIVENQLEVSDHTHLGQILTYAAGTDPTTVVWVAAGFRAEHRAAVDWLNDRTDENTRFFAIEIQVIKIGESLPAPAFKLVAQPNDWGKQVRAAAAPSSGQVSAREQAYWEFWGRFRTRVLAEYPTWTYSSQSTKSSWFPMSAGLSGVNWTAAFTRGGLTVTLEFVGPDADVNTQRFEALLAHSDVFDSTYGGVLTWDALDGKKSCRVQAVHEGYKDVTDQSDWDAWVDWFITTEVSMRAALAAVGGPSVFNG